MNPMYRGMFTLTLIIVFFIQLPVRMFPASPGGQGLPPLLSKEMSFHPDVGYSAGERAPLNKKTGPEIGEKRNQFLQPEIYNAAPFHPDSQVGFRSQASTQMNDRENVARPTDHHDFYNGEGLGKVIQDLNPVKSVPSLHTDRPRDDFIDSKLTYVSRRLENISSNLADMSIVFTTDLSDTQTRAAQSLSSGKQSDSQPTGVVIDAKNTIIQENIDDRSQTEQFTDQGTLLSDQTKVKNGVYWSPDVEKHCPSGFSDSDLESWRNHVKTLEVVKIENGCGSMQNRMVTFNDSSKACVRYRLNTDLMQGDMYSFYLGLLLGIRHTPPTTLVHHADNGQWQRVEKEIKEAKWSDQKPLILSQWVNNLVPVYAPRDPRNQEGRLHPTNVSEDLPMSELCSLVQWSDLIVFDYMSANLDRVVNNMFNLRWNPAMMQKPIHNLEKSGTSDSFVYLDNESGLFHGYRLLDTYGQFHQSLLDTVCIFRKSTADAIEKLHKDGNIGDQLQQLFRQQESHHISLPRIPPRHVNILEKRLDGVYKQIKTCRNMYSGL